jgi:hypothetical protein
MALKVPRSRHCWFAAHEPIKVTKADCYGRFMATWQGALLCTRWRAFIGQLRSVIPTFRMGHIGMLICKVCC